MKISKRSRLIDYNFEHLRAKSRWADKADIEKKISDRASLSAIKRRLLSW